MSIAPHETYAAPAAPADASRIVTIENEIDWVAVAVVRTRLRLRGARRELPVWLPTDAENEATPQPRDDSMRYARRWHNWHRRNWEELVEFINPQSAYEDDTNPIFRLSDE